MRLSLAVPGEMPGTVPLYADLDGDKARDIVAARLLGNDYGILIMLSSRSGLMKLTPPEHLGLFTVHVCDVNNDNFPDILIRSPAAIWPAAIWLGNGNGEFEAADRNFFQNEFGLSTPTAHRNSPRMFEQDLLNDQPNPVCEQTRAAIDHSNPNLNGLLQVFLTPVVHSTRIGRLVPRGPPAVSAI